MKAVYIDTSAFLRAFFQGSDDHDASAALVADEAHVLISSELLWLEADRAAIRLMHDNPRLTDLATAVSTGLDTIDMVPLDHSVVTAARAIPEIVKSLDALHVATAEFLADAIDCVVTYDKTMATMLRTHGIVACTAGEALARAA